MNKNWSLGNSNVLIPVLSFNQCAKVMNLEREGTIWTITILGHLHSTGGINKNFTKRHWKTCQRIMKVRRLAPKNARLERTKQKAGASDAISRWLGICNQLHSLLPKPAAPLGFLSCMNGITTHKLLSQKPDTLPSSWAPQSNQSPGPVASIYWVSLPCCPRVQASSISLTATIYCNSLLSGPPRCFPSSHLPSHFLGSFFPSFLCFFFFTFGIF